MDIGVFNLLIVCWCFLCLLICDYKWCKKLNLHKYNIVMGWGWLLFLLNDLKKKRIRVLFVSQVSIRVVVLCDTVSLNQHYLLIDLKHQYNIHFTVFNNIEKYIVVKRRQNQSDCSCWYNSIFFPLCFEDGCNIFWSISML